MNETAIKATEVFTPNSFPKHTYVERQNKVLEQRLRDGLDTPGQIVSVAGPSKSGKTVLIERVVGIEKLITVTGAGIHSAEMVWNRILDWLGEPHELSASNISKVQAGAEIEGTVKGNAILASLEGRAMGSAAYKTEKETGLTVQRRGMTQVIDYMTGAGDDYVILIDDFHYISRNTQTEIAQHIKEMARNGVKICVASVHHRSDDVVRANADLRGRVLSVDVAYWQLQDLSRIAEIGFSKLNATLDPVSINHFAIEAAGSPQLMQSICLQACFEVGLRTYSDVKKEVHFTADQRAQIFERTTSTSNYRTLCDILAAGPKTRGTDRLIYNFKNGKRGDVYSCILHAIAANPARLSFHYDEIVERVKRLCRGEPPAGSSLTGSCIHMAKLAAEKHPDERVLDWDEQKTVLDVPDPYLIFYLRWSGFLETIEEGG